WSSDGSRIAYVAAKAGEPCRIMVTTVPAGEGHQVARCKAATGTSLTWRPHTPFLYFTDQKSIDGRYITRLNMETGERLDLKRPVQWILTMRASPDGKSLALLHLFKHLTCRVLVIDLESGREREL